MNTTINESSRRDLFIDIVVQKFIFKNEQKRSCPVSPSYEEQVQDYPKQELFFTV